MLAFLGVFLIGIHSPRAQSNTEYFAAVRIHDIDPESSGPFDVGSPGELTVDNSSFEYQHGRSIFVEDNEDPTDGDAAVITITNNTFGIIDTHDRNTDPDAAAFGTYGIYIKGLDANYDGLTPSLVGTVMVEDNLFTTNNWSRVNPSYPTVPNLEYAAAICFENTTGNIIGNRILDPAYTNGILLMATIPQHFSYPPPSMTYVCSNTIENLYPQAGGTSPAPELLTGISTQYHIGLIKLNSITNCEVGLLANGLGHNYLAYNSIDNYYATYPHTYDIEQAIRVESPSATNYLDLSGQHGATSAPPDNGAFNMITATYDDWSIGMITIGSNSQLILDNEYQGFTWTQYAQNNMYLANPSFPSPSTSTQPTAADAYILKGLGGSPALFPGLDFNFWGIDAGGNKIDPLNEGGPLAPHEWNAAAGSGQQNAANISITTLPSNTLGSESTFSGVACLTSEYEGTKHKGAKPLSNDSVPTGCQLSFNLGMGLSSEGQYAASYDSLKDFVQTCPTNVNAPGAFGIMSADVAEGGNEASPGGCESFRQWLLSALAWNPGNQTYFCADVQSIPAACGSPDDSTYAEGNTVTNEGLSVLYWIIHNPICANSFDSQLYVQSRGSQIRTWLDTQDTDSVKLDTTIYTMQQLGLDSVLLYAGLLSVSNNTPSIITNATAYPNPAGEGTVISFGITREAYVSVNLFNVLGHQVENAGFGGVVEPGNLSVPMSLQGLPSGTYFARIVTTFGEVQSVKIVKE